MSPTEPLSTNPASGPSLPLHETGVLRCSNESVLT